MCQSWSVHELQQAVLDAGPGVMSSWLLQCVDTYRIRLQEVAALDLYCGCGGLSFIDGVYTADGVEIQTKWAVDYNESCCASFQANYPKAQARQSCYTMHCCGC